MDKSVTPSRALVWGARGFIGRHLVVELLARGYDVSVLTRGGGGVAPTWSSQVTWYQFGSCQAGRTAWDRALKDVEIVYNLAGSSGAVASNRNPLESLDSNCRLQLEFLEACAASGCMPHVVFASSRLVYAPQGRTPVSEKHPVAPRSMYAAHKLCVEHYHQIYGAAKALTYTICRISNPFGPDPDPDVKSYGFINTLIARARLGASLPLFGRGHQLRDYLYIRDLVEALGLCAEQPQARNQVFNIGRGRSVSVFDAARVIRARAGGGFIEFRPWPADHAAVESGDYVADVRKAAELLGFTARFDLTSGLDDMLGETLAVAGPLTQVVTMRG
jgi:UDP-glucose 4-epimerase